MSRTLIVIHYQDRDTGKMVQEDFSNVHALAQFLKDNPQLAKDVDYVPKTKPIYPGGKRRKPSRGKNQPGMG